MHVWVGLPDSSELVDFSTGTFRKLAQERFGLRWLGPDPPAFIWGVPPDGTIYEPHKEAADSDESGHLFQSMSDTIPILSDSCRSEATLGVTYKGVSDRSQDFVTGFAFIRSPFQGRRFAPPPGDVVAPSIRAGGERRQPTPELQFGLPPVATRNGLTRPSE
jgi:hypothetical protein